MRSRRHPGEHEQYARVHLYPAFGDVPIGKVNARLLEEFYAELRRCRDRCNARPTIEHRVDGPHECRTVKHRRRPGRPPAGGYPPHDCAEAGCTVVERRPHACHPLSAGTIRRIHFAIRGVLSAAERWGGSQVIRPRSPVSPASRATAQAADGGPGRPDHRGGMGEDQGWGTLVWLVMVTGIRRAEPPALRWSDMDLDKGAVTVRRNYVRVNRNRLRRIRRPTNPPPRARPGDGRGPSRAPRRYTTVCRELEVHIHALLCIRTQATLSPMRTSWTTRTWSRGRFSEYLGCNQRTRAQPLRGHHRHIRPQDRRPARARKPDCASRLARGADARTDRAEHRRGRPARGPVRGGLPSCREPMIGTRLGWFRANSPHLPVRRSLMLVCSYTTYLDPQGGALWAPRRRVSDAAAAVAGARGLRPVPARRTTAD